MTLGRSTAFHCLSVGTLRCRGFPEGFVVDLSMDLGAENCWAMLRELKDPMGLNLDLS